MVPTIAIRVAIRGEFIEESKRPSSPVSEKEALSGRQSLRIVAAGRLARAADQVKVDPANDLALLKADGKFTALPVASSRTMHLGKTVATVGFPNIGLQGFAPKLAKGEIATLSGAQDDARYFQISVNYAVKSSFLLSFLESVPDVASKLKEPETKDRKFEDVVKSAEKSSVVVLVY